MREIRKKLSLKYYNCCHPMLDFMAKVHQIRFRLGLPHSQLRLEEGKRGEGRNKEREENGEGRRGSEGERIWKGTDNLEMRRKGYEKRGRRGRKGL